MASLAEGEENYIRLALLLIGVTPRAVRTYFDREFPPTSLPLTLSTCHNTLLDLKLRRIINQAQWNCLIPRKGVPDSKTFDVTLMICLIRNLTSINPPINGFDRLPIPGEIGPGSDLARIKCYRNKLAHHDSNTIDTAYFNTAWRDISDAVSRLGGQTMNQECQWLKVKILDQSTNLEIMEHVEAMKQMKLTIDNLEIGHSKMTENIKKLQYLHSNLQTSHRTLKTEHSKVMDISKDPVPMNIKDSKVPIEIRLMSNKTYVPLYLKLLESGSEKKRDIRLVIVGKKGTGKTSLLKRLFGEETSNRKSTSTNGIEIHRIRCKANYDDGIWYRLDGKNEETELHARLLKPYEDTLTSRDKQPIDELVKATNTQHVQGKTYTPDTILYMRKSMEVEAKYLQSEKDKPLITTEHQPTDPSLEQAFTDIEIMLKSKVDLDDKEEYATLLLWDFAGDEEFYHTHQTFLSSDAIYLVVTKLNEVDDKEAQDLFRLWMDSIHCYSRLENEKNKSEDIRNISEDLDPPVVIVGTWKDALTSKSSEIKDACRRNLLMFTEAMSEDERGHIRSEVLISNTEDNDSVFQQMRLNILKLARKMKTWNQSYPLKFIQLEKRLQEKRKEVPIIAFDELKHIAAETLNPLNKEELILYLKFHHEIRALVYFEDLPDYIILDTQWLSDAFKSIVTAKKFQTMCISIKNQKLWEEFHCKGKLHDEVLEDIFKGEQTLNENKEHILNVMEKFDIIIRPMKSERYSTDEKTCYYVPCMIKSEPECDIYEMFNVTENTCKKSTWLCLKFRFLPPNLMNHLIASLCREYEVAEVVVTKYEKGNINSQQAKNRMIVKQQIERVIALFRGTAVFELKKTTKLTKLLITTCPNIILVQVLEFGRKVVIKRGMYKHIADFITDEIQKIISTRFKMTNVNFDKKWECGFTKSESVIGSNDFSEEQSLEYYCGTCTTTHDFTDEWSDLQIKTLHLSQSSEDTPQTNSKTETTNKNQNISTKVRCSFQGDMRVFTNVSDESTKGGGLIGFTKDEFNFAKMGMIVLNILADVLYDLLKKDKQNIRPRSNCDVTYLYSELRKLNKHIPSTGWGGTWQTIQSTDIAIGDDIERIRLTRNEVYHSQTFELDEQRCTDLCNMIVDLLKRFDQHNKQGNLYTDHLNKILAKTISNEEMKDVRQLIVPNIVKSEMAIELEIEHQVNVTPQ